MWQVSYLQHTCSIPAAYLAGLISGQVCCMPDPDDRGGVEVACKRRARELSCYADALLLELLVPEACKRRVKGVQEACKRALSYKPLKTLSAGSGMQEKHVSW